MKTSIAIDQGFFIFSGSYSNFFINDLVFCAGKEYQVSALLQSNNVPENEIDWLELCRWDANGVMFKKYATPAEVVLISRPVE